MDEECNWLQTDIWHRLIHWVCNSTLHQVRKQSFEDSDASVLHIRWCARSRG